MSDRASEAVFSPKRARRDLRIESGGTEIVLSVWDQDLTAPTVVFLPGTMTHPLYYEDFLTRLSEEGLNVVGVHFQGHGLSPRVDVVLTFQDLVRNARDAIEFATKHFEGRVILLGSSQGGIVAMAAASHEPRLAGVFAHNILDPALSDSILVTRFPRWLRAVYSPLRLGFRLVARLFPRIPIPIGFYLDVDRVCLDPASKEAFLSDPIGLTSYPLGFLASVFSADLSGMRDGTVSCPVVVVAASDDPLFPANYTRQVFDEIAAPRKEMLVFDVRCHLLFNEQIDDVLPRLAKKILDVARQGDSEASWDEARI